MSRGSLRYIDSTYGYRHNSVEAPITNPVIYGRFPKYVHKKSSAEKINKVLSLLLLLLVFLSLASYYFVSDSEKNMNNLGREIVSLSNENIELQNKLDNLHSFKKIDTEILQNADLQAAKNIIEVPEIKMNSAPKINPMPVNYAWTIGY